jgi:hypothetical protein
MEWPGEIPAIFYFAIILNRHRKHFFGDTKFNFYDFNGREGVSL